jgi:MFS family permease
MTLVMERNGVDAAVIGLNSAMTPLAVLLVTPFLPRVVARLGTLPSMYIGLAIGVVAVLLMPVMTSLTAWFVLRFLIGFGMSLQWLVSETWLNTVADERSRGRVMGVYATVLAGGFAVGPLLVGATGIDGFLPFVAAAGAIAASAPPLLFARGVAPRMPEKHSLSILALAAAAPVVMAAGVAGGTIDMAVLALLPLYGLRAGFDQEMAVTLLVLFTAGNLLLQYPIGWLADRMDRRLVLVACAGSGVVGSLILPFVLDQPPLLWTLLFIWGGTLLGIYTVGLSLLGQTSSAGALAAANAAFIVAYEIGSIAGPVIAGVAMDAIGPNGLLFLVGGVSLVFIPVVMLGRR